MENFCDWTDKFCFVGKPKARTVYREEWLKSETLTLTPADPQANWEKEKECPNPPPDPLRPLLEEGRVATVIYKELAECPLLAAVVENLHLGSWSSGRKRSQAPKEPLEQCPAQDKPPKTACGMNQRQKLWTTMGATADKGQG